MAKQKEVKTNAMRILERMKISYITHTYECDEFIDGQQTADLLGFPHEIMFKTLVTVSPDKSYYVFAIPIDEELDLKKAAKAASCKSLAMIHVKELLGITGYVRGGCTAIGMKKQYKTFLDSSSLDCDSIVVSAGKIGAQVELSPQDLIKLTRAETALLTKEP